MSNVPRISEHMTASPHLIGAEQPLAKAHELMKRHSLRHLPVLHGGRLVGVISLRDVSLVETMPGVDPEKVPVEEAMSSDVYAVTPEQPLTSVTREMAARKLGCAAVMAHGKVVGIFTLVDALHVLERALEALVRADVRLV